MDPPSEQLRIFLSSTSADLATIRASIQQAILRLEHLPVGLETFVSQPGIPAHECCAKAASADVVIVVVAHRYGFVPTRELGGDGRRSITWLEVDAAYTAGKSVLAFLVDPEAPWSSPKEQDRLLTEHESTQEIIENIRNLQEFKAYLQNHFLCSNFSNGEDLATKVTASLARIHAAPVTERFDGRPAWSPCIAHTLQPARHFEGRDALLDEIVEWAQARVSEKRIISVVAAGGTGKTALIERVLSQLDNRVPAGVLVWSFYEDPKTEEFLRVACQYFAGGADTPTGGRLERLQRALSGPLPHLLVLDGLERVQAEGTGSRQRGLLEDPQLKRLLRFIASGRGQARALITTRFSVVDLEDWDEARCGIERLDDLDDPSARAVLRKWGVRGDDSTLDRLIKPLHGHALSVAILGSYLGHFRNGDPSKAPAFKPGDVVAHDPKAAKLSRILGEYTKALGSNERDLLALVANFPRGARLDLLHHLARSGRRVSGNVSGYTAVQLNDLLERLRHLGLIFAYGSGTERSYSAHPFLREYFKDLLGVPASRIYDALRSLLTASPSLLGRPDIRLPTEAWELDHYETLIEHTRLAGRVGEAFTLYWEGLGSFNHLGKSLGENARGLRIVSGFSSDGDVETIFGLSREERSLLATAWGLYAAYLGDLLTARRCFEVSFHATRGATARAAVLLNQCEVELLSGKLLMARETAEAAQALAARERDSDQMRDSHAYLGAVLTALGDLEGARKHFQGASSRSICGVWKAEFLARCGEVSAAEAKTLENRTFCEGFRHWRDVAYCDALLARLLLRYNPSAAQVYVDAAREFGARSGEVEILLRASLAATEVSLAIGDLVAGKDVAEAGILLADGCQFQIHGIEMRLALAKVHLHAGDGRSALYWANEALTRATGRECQFAWGEAEALSILGLANDSLGEHELARHHLTAAIVAQTRLSHPDLESTRTTLDQLFTRMRNTEGSASNSA